MASDIASDVTWQPGDDYIARSRVLALMRTHGIDSYEDFYRRSITDIAWFWEAVVRDELRLEWFRPYDQVVDLSDGPAWPHWFVGGKLNYVVNAVDRHARTQPDKTAVAWEGEDGETRSFTYAELLDAVG